jgi:hypothetical protein
MSVLYLAISFANWNIGWPISGDESCRLVFSLVGFLTFVAHFLSYVLEGPSYEEIKKLREQEKCTP